ncbi:MAG: tRNA pseudouridine(55) synthase TruB [Bryobacterales bacterium]|nr:tRNA pseudouridine(55) synthase TruB [Bryobacterales bacterium]
MDGVIVVNKPEGWTSHDVVNKMRRIAGTRRVGHLGTLDPMATGVLPLVLNRATRLAQFYVRSDKKYEALIRFGHSTDSYDRDGQPLSEHVAVSLDRAQLENTLQEFRGTQLQRPPAISAKKIAGTPAYKLARKKIAVDLEPVEINIYSLDLLEFRPDEIRLAVHCSAGAYVRSLAHDLGQKLGCGAWLEQLCRTMSGDFTISNAHTLPELESLAAGDRLNEALIPASKLLPQFPAEIVDTVTANQIRQGRDFRASPFRVQRGAKYVKAIGPQGDLVAIGEVKLPNLYHPVLVL